jgi:hypothetical protein
MGGEKSLKWPICKPFLLLRITNCRQKFSSGNMAPLDSEKKFCLVCITSRACCHLKALWLNFIDLFSLIFIGN